MESAIRKVFGLPLRMGRTILGLGLIEFWVLELDVLLERALGAIALVASACLASIAPRNFLCSSSESFFAFRRLPANIILKIFSFFLT